MTKDQKAAMYDILLHALDSVTAATEARGVSLESDLYLRQIAMFVVHWRKDQAHHEKQLYGHGFVEGLRALEVEDL